MTFRILIVHAVKRTTLHFLKAAFVKDYQMPAREQ